jgi:DNA-binding transcriptional MocR family regulator
MANEMSHFDTLILEDDAYGELRFEGEPQPSLYWTRQPHTVQ